MLRSPFCSRLLAARLAMLAVTLATSAQAQPVEIAGGALVPVSGRLGPGWSAQPGLAGQILFPAYGGETRLSLDLASHETTEADLPAFTALVATLGWGPTVTLGPARLGVGAEVGAGRYAFDDAGRFGDNASSESEVVAGAYLRASAPVAGRVHVWTEAGARRTFFSTIATTTSVSAGLSVRL
ncbi:MAG: hypothetical protein AAF791_13030 [Bacteroidota bacterium]